MKPLNSLILIEYEEPVEKKTETGIYVPPTADNNALGHLREGKVIEINRKEETEDKDIKIGDTVLFNKLAATKVPGNDKLRLIRKEDLYAVL